MRRRLGKCLRLVLVSEIGDALCLVRPPFQLPFASAETLRQTRTRLWRDTKGSECDDSNAERRADTLGIDGTRRDKGDEQLSQSPVSGREI